MAIMIPAEPAPTRSLAERRLFNRFRRELPDDSFVLHSLGLTTHPTKLWGECDFVVLSRLGIFVIEIKGGGVSCANGEWVFRRHDGGETVKREGPFAQALSAMCAVREEIEKTPRLRGFLFGYGVIMPDELFTHTGTEIEPAVLLDKRNIRTLMSDYIRQISTFVAEELAKRKEGKTYRLPQKRELEEIRHILRPDFRTALTLNSSLCQIEQEQVRLTEEQANLLHRMEANPRTLIKGGAGTGKTILALDVAAREAKHGPVLYLCFNKLLGRHVKEHVQRKYSGAPIEADYIHSWCRQQIEKAGMRAQLEAVSSADPGFYTGHFPTVAADAILQLEPKPYSCIILDEGQDLLRGAYLDLLDLVLDGGLGSGKWHVFYDPNQGIYSGLDPKELQRLTQYGCAQFPLTINCRNTQAIAVQTSIVSGIDSASEGAIDGGMAEVEFIKSAADGIARLERWIKKLRGEGVERNNMLILGRRVLANSSLAQVPSLDGLRVRDLASDDPGGRESIDFCTMHAFKGLERRVVLAWDLDALDHDESRLLHYCGLSRALACLVTFIPESQRTCYDRFASEFGGRRARAPVRA